MEEKKVLSDEELEEVNGGKICFEAGDNPKQLEGIHKPTKSIIGIKPIINGLSTEDK